MLALLVATAVTCFGFCLLGWIADRPIGKDEDNG
jgi:hypothetical protein